MLRNFEINNLNKLLKRNGVVDCNLSEKLTKHISLISKWHIKNGSTLGVKSDNAYSLFFPPIIVNNINFDIPIIGFILRKLIGIIKFSWKSVIKYYLIHIIEKEIPIRKLVKNYFKSKNSSLTKIDIDCYLNKPSNRPVINWHRDGALRKDSEKKNLKKFNTDTIKLFLFLDPNEDKFVVKKDITKYPSLAVVPACSDAVRCIDYLIINKKIPGTGNNHTLEEMKKNSEYILSKSNELISNKNFQDLENFLNQINVLENISENKFDIEGKPSKMILFDDRNLHRGSPTGKNYRMVLRLMFRSKIF